MVPVRIIKKKYKRISLSKKNNLIFNKLLLNKIIAEKIINIKLIFIIIFPAIKLKGINASNRLKKVDLDNFKFDNRYI